MSVTGSSLFSFQFTGIWVGSCCSDKRLSAWKAHLLPRQQRATYICRTLSSNNSKAWLVSLFGFATSEQLVLDLCNLAFPRWVCFCRPGWTNKAPKCIFCTFLVICKFVFSRSLNKVWSSYIKSFLIVKGEFLLTL